MRRLAVALLILSLLTLGLSSAASADVNDFYISDYEIDMKLSRNQSTSRSSLATQEVITAVFPDRDQNRGIERYIPREYDGHPVGLRVDSVLDSDGQPHNYTTYNSGEYAVVRIGDEDKYVRGQQTYVINYTQQDVTAYFEDAAKDEFYWDTNGTAWNVPIQNLKVTATVDGSIIPQLTGEWACYQGRQGSEDQCSQARFDDGVLRAHASNLAIGENITLAIGFQSGTFSPYEQSLLDKIINLWVGIQLATGVVGLGFFVALITRFVRRSRRSSEVGTVIPEYLPPSGASVSISSLLIPLPSSALTAQLLDLAVRRYIKIYEKSPAKTFSAAVYELEIVKSIDDLRPEEKEVVSDLFQSSAVGTKIDTKELQKDTGLHLRILDNNGKARQLMRNKYGLESRSDIDSQWFRRVGWVALGLGVALLSLPILAVGIGSFILSAIFWRLSDEGLALSRYLKGLKSYISVAEKERLVMLQSPGGAEKVGVSSDDTKQLIKVYERLLPYAVLFGYEKQWNEQLGKYYDASGVQPSWYVGNSGAFNAATFGAAMSQLSTSIATSGATYSYSSGSSGGGFSGGGGGGGGGGGW